jgi:hypothetical protein
MEVQNYLNGLDNIVMGDGHSTETNNHGNTYCQGPLYGQFIIVINKMMGGSPDIDLQKELMEPEPGKFHFCNETCTVVQDLT